MAESPMLNTRKESFQAKVDLLSVMNLLKWRPKKYLPQKSSTKTLCSEVEPNSSLCKKLSFKRCFQRQKILSLSASNTFLKISKMYIYFWSYVKITPCQNFKRIGKNFTSWKRNVTPNSFARASTSYTKILLSTEI